MRRLISVGLAAALLLAAAPVALGLLHGLSRGHGEAASSSLTCSVKTSCTGPGEVAVFRMSGAFPPANAHAGTRSGSTYANLVCCSGVTGLSESCSGTYDTVLWLYALTNAHVSETSGGGYSTQVCLSAPSTVMDCYYETDSPPPTCDAGYACVATISGATNAHVADCDGSNDYATRVCCAAQAACTDRLGDTSCDDPVNDADDDGCTDAEEQAGALSPKPGSTGAYNPAAWYDFYDVPVPAKADAAGANGIRSKAVAMSDVLAVLMYVGTSDGGGLNPNGVDYDTIKGVDLDGDTDNDIPSPHAIEEGQKYDRSPSALPNPPWEAGPPSGAISMADVLAVLAQVGLSCAGPP